MMKMTKKKMTATTKMKTNQYKKNVIYLFKNGGPNFS